MITEDFPMASEDDRSFPTAYKYSRRFSRTSEPGRNPYMEVTPPPPPTGNITWIWPKSHISSYLSQFRPHDDQFIHKELSAQENIYYKQNSNVYVPLLDHIYGIYIKMRHLPGH